jgi:hypothetical protein
MEHVITLWANYRDIFNVRADGAYSYGWSLNGYVSPWNRTGGRQLAVGGDILHILNVDSYMSVPGREVDNWQVLRGGNGVYTLYCLTVGTFLGIEMKTKVQSFKNVLLLANISSFLDIFIELDTFKLHTS